MVIDTKSSLNGGNRVSSLLFALFSLVELGSGEAEVKRRRCRDDLQKVRAGEEAAKPHFGQFKVNCALAEGGKLEPCI
jgi:hypothetical protein